MIESVPNYLEGLNPPQLEAVLHQDGPLLLLAGAGSGKTRVITMRIAYLIDQLKVDPSSILAVTFTNKAAREMQERIAQLVPNSQGMMIRTFHSFCAWLLRRNGHHIGLSSQFTIYDDDDVVSLLKTIEPNIPKKELRQYSRWISRAKDENLTPESGLSHISYNPEFPLLFNKYEDKLRGIGNIDFGGLIQRTVELLNTHKQVRQRIQQRFRIILVDEYQDSNGAQYELLRSLCTPSTWLCVVGDDDQSIYGFRGAEVKHILRFQSQFPDTKIIRLEQNYRSTQNILDIASAVVANNKDRLGKTLWTENPQGAKAQLKVFENHEEEARFVCDLVDGDGNWANTAVLYRTNAQSRVFESALTRRGIPFRLVGALRFYEREEIKDALSMLSFLVNSRDEVAFDRIINKPSRGLGAVSVKKIKAFGISTEGDLFLACQQALQHFKGKAALGVQTFISVVEDARDHLEKLSLGELIQFIIQRSGLLEYYKNQDEISSTSKVENLEELINAASPYSQGVSGLSEFLEHIELDRVETEKLEEGDCLTLITMHNTKGLEFDRVIITGMEDGLFPRNREGYDTSELEEERRLFYVAITRARKNLILTTCRFRMLHGKTFPSEPSLFLDEIPKDRIDIEGGSLPSRSPYSPGTRIYHDDYGAGYVVKLWNSGGEEVVICRFDSGRTAQFITEFAALEKIADY